MSNPSAELAISMSSSRERQRLLDLFELAAMGPLAARVAHDINNPLAGMKNAFLLLKDAVSKDHEYFEYVGRIEQEMDRIADLVRAMHQAYRGRLREPEWLRPQEDLIDECAHLLHPFAAARNVRVDCSGPEHPRRVRTTRDEVLQALLPVLRNAVEASPTDGVVEVSARVGDAELTIAVVDRGRGIAPDALPMIFEPFFTTKDNGRAEGLGVGLAVCASALKSLGGRVEVETRPGEGSCFLLKVPCEVGGRPGSV